MAIGEDPLGKSLGTDPHALVEAWTMGLPIRMFHDQGSFQHEADYPARPGRDAQQLVVAIDRVLDPTSPAGSKISASYSWSESFRASFLQPNGVIPRELEARVLREDDVMTISFADSKTLVLARHEAGDLETSRERLSRNPPAHEIEPDVLAAITPDLEQLLRLADLYADDPANPLEMRLTVGARRRTLLSEIQLPEPAVPDALIVARTTAFLMRVFADQLIAESGGDSPDAQAADQLAEGATAISDDSTAVDGGEEIGETVADLAVQRDPDGAGAAFARGGKNFLEHDFWEKHVNRVITAGLTVGGTALANAATDGKLGALARAAIALLRARFPWALPLP